MAPLLTVPVTDRGEAIGLLELTLPQVPDEQIVANVAVGFQNSAIASDLRFRRRVRTR
jgi:hypothetical protein